MDNHSTHCTSDVYRFCESNGIILLTIPPHTYIPPMPLWKLLIRVNAPSIWITIFSQNYNIRSFRVVHSIILIFAPYTYTTPILRCTGIWHQHLVFPAEDFTPADPQNNIQHSDVILRENQTFLFEHILSPPGPSSFEPNHSRASQTRQRKQ